MSHSLKTPVTGVPESDNPHLGKGHKVHLSNTVKTKEKQQNKDVSAHIIQKAWLSHLDKTVFQLLKRTICAAAEADAYKIMGRKKFYHQIKEDERLFQKFKITDDIDIVTLKDYMQYSSHLDEIPASSGGRNNCWRRLSLENIPRTMIMYDIVDYAESGIISKRLKKEMKYLLQRPKTEEMRQHQLQIVSEVRSPLSLSSLQPLYRPYQQQSQIRHLGRRSKQALMKVEKMKRAYKMAKEKNASVGSEPKMDIPGAKQKETVVFSAPSFDIVKVKELSDDELEKEEKELFAWCQDLFINNSPSF
ncbi:uncharacterized protein CXorf58 homolog isoform X4 [Bubalus kerabau]|uniref:uncharacterized protein CXorf58 homolog isoform X4 n=2 Tax=Bubalus TaxID=9918 RepID=UPI000DBC501F|nr:putative uncharacterized protein CXorf58 homolog isoform X4 [Bubalus bubalis]XP_055421545.1 uncharacterized protein CXorf58 homolog isoform X4 [Bubalus carabanensis]